VKVLFILFNVFTLLKKIKDEAVVTSCVNEDLTSFKKNENLALIRVYGVLLNHFYL